VAYPCKQQLHSGRSLKRFTYYRIADQAAIALYNARYERLEQLVKERTEELEQEK